MRRPARDLVRAIAWAIVGCTWPAVAHCNDAASLKVIRGLDGAQYLEGEPMWFCAEPQAGGGSESRRATPPAYRLIGIEDAGRAVRAEVDLQMRNRAGDFGECLRAPSGGPLEGSASDPAPWTGVLRAGQYSVHSTGADSQRVLARFRVLAPRGSELSVRAGYARARRLMVTGGLEDRKQAESLCRAMLARYPRSSYATRLYAMKWALGHKNWWDPPDDAEKYEEMFALFHNSCFGVYALERWVHYYGQDSVGPTLRRLVGLYPDTRLARAAATLL